jgi:hypothetical protein
MLAGGLWLFLVGGSLALHPNWHEGSLFTRFPWLAPLFRTQPLPGMRGRRLFGWTPTN